MTLTNERLEQIEQRHQGQFTSEAYDVMELIADLRASRAQVETAERQRDELATVLGRLTDCIIENGHGFRLDRYDQVCVAMNDAENALAALDTPPAKEA